MTKIRQLSVGTGYKRQNGTLYLKDGDTVHSKFTIDPTYGIWVVEREKETLDPNEEVEPINSGGRRNGQTASPTRSSRGAHRTPTQQASSTPLTEDALLAAIDHEWVAHDSLLRSLRQRWTVSDMDFTVLETKLRSSGEIVRERRPVGRKMSFCYKKST
jgi:hypothetical protein